MPEHSAAIQVRLNAYPRGPVGLVGPDTWRLTLEPQGGPEQ